MQKSCWLLLKEMKYRLDPLGIQDENAWKDESSPNFDFNLYGQAAVFVKQFHVRTPFHRFHAVVTDVPASFLPGRYVLPPSWADGRTAVPPRPWCAVPAAPDGKAFCSCLLYTSVAMPLVWMYSFFDTFNLRAQIGAGTAPQDDYLVHIKMCIRDRASTSAVSWRISGSAIWEIRCCRPRRSFRSTPKTSTSGSRRMAAPWVWKPDVYKRQP